MAAYLPGFEASAVLGPYIAVALAMVGVTIVVLALAFRKATRPPLVTEMLLAVLVIAGGSVLLLALVFAFLNPDQTSAWTWVLLAFNFMMAVPIGLWFVGLVVYRDRRIGARGWSWPLLLAAATTGSEVLMGVLFAVGEAGAPLSTPTALGDGFSSVWYFWSMAAIMAGPVLWASLRPSERAVAWGLLGSAVIAPWVAAFPLVGGVAIAVVMAAVVASVLRLLVRQRVGADEARFLFGASAAFVAMTLSGLVLVASGGSDAGRTAFGIAMGSVMTGEIAYLVRTFYAPRPAPRPLAGPADLTAPPETAGA